MVIKYMTVTWSNITIYFVSHLNISKSYVYQNVVYVSNKIIAKIDEILNQFRMITMVDKILNRHSWDNCYAKLLSNQCLCDTKIP